MLSFYLQTGDDIFEDFQFNTSNTVCCHEMKKFCVDWNIYIGHRNSTGYSSS